MEDYGQQGSKYGYGTTRKDSRGSGAGSLNEAVDMLMKGNMVS